MTTIYVLIYLSLAVALAASIVRAVRYARLPLNLRWELYPVPHEDAAHAGHGGSYFEDLDWWMRPRHRSIAGEAKAMAAEILFLRAMYEHNRRLWLFSYPFHLGLYILIATAVAAAAAAIVSPQFSALSLMGAAGCVLVILGTTGLLVNRVRDPKLRSYSAPADYCNLVFFLTAAGLLFYTKIAPGPGLIDTARALLTFDTAFNMPALQAAAMAISALLIAYIPLTHMSHFIGKYFTYHAIRWADEPASAIHALDRRLAEYLGYKPTWSAPHIAGDGATAWLEIVSRNPSEEQSK